MPARPDDLTIANWIDAPHNRWGFWHVRELTRTARISRGSGPVSLLPEEPRPLDAVVVEHDGCKLSWREWLSSTWSDALVVLHDGKLVYEWYTDGYGPPNTHLLMSCSKSLTSLCVGALVADRLLDTESLVTDVIPSLAGTSFEGATVQHLLDMRTGTRFDEVDYENPMSDGRLLEEVSGYRPRIHEGLAPDTATWIGTLENSRPHGGAFEYRSILTDVLAWIAQEISGEHFARAFSERIWARIGAEYDADIIVDESGFPAAEGGICTTARDFARVGLMALQQGELDGRRVLPASWFARLRQRDQDLIDAYVTAMGSDPNWPDACYHDQWWVAHPEAGIYAAYGINGQQLFVHHPTNTVVAKFSTWPNADGEVALQDAGLFALCEHLGR